MMADAPQLLALLAVVVAPPVPAVMWQAAAVLHGCGEVVVVVAGLGGPAGGPVAPGASSAVRVAAGVM